LLDGFEIEEMAIPCEEDEKSFGALLLTITGSVG